MKRFISRPLAIITHQLTSWQKIIHDRTILETAHHRTVVMGGVFFLAFIVVSMRLFDVMILRNNSGHGASAHNVAATLPEYRSDIIDRNGEVLATHLITASVYANPKVVINPEEAATKLASVFPDLSYEALLKKLSSDKGFIWVVRHISPKMQYEVNRLGIPGLYLERDERRVYPHGNLVSHILGYCGVDNDGLAGIEKYFDSRLRKDSQALQLSLDVRVQYVVHQELSKAVREFSAEGANAVVMDVDTGEVLAMVSLPDYNPNLPNQNAIDATFNRNTLALYESGSTFKIFNTAISLESGKSTLASIYDASNPIRVGARKISDFKGKNRPLSVREVFIYSSNIGSAKMALDFGAITQQSYLERFGLFAAPKIELPEISPPLVPKTWGDVTTMTVSYGYGIAVSPLMLIDAVRSIIKGYRLFPMTLIKRSPTHLVASDANPKQIVSQKTAAHIRDLMRLVITEGTARKADVPGYDVIGKTGTAHKNKGRGGYNDARMTSFIGAFPKDKPKYIMVLFLDNPRPTKETFGYATGGWTAAPVSGRIIARLGPLLGVAPNAESLEGNDLNNLIAIKHTVDKSNED